MAETDTPIEDVNAESVAPVEEKPEVKAEPEPKPKPKKKKAKALSFRCGLTVDGMNRVIDGEERLRMGHADYPWSKDLRADILEAVQDCRNMSDVRKRVRDVASKARGGDGRAVV